MVGSIFFILVLKIDREMWLCMDVYKDKMMMLITFLAMIFEVVFLGEQMISFDDLYVGFGDHWLCNRCSILTALPGSFGKLQLLLILWTWVDLEDIFLSWCWTKDSKAKEDGAKLSTKISEILWSERYISLNILISFCSFHLVGELNLEVTIFCETWGKEMEQHSTFKLLTHQTWISPAL